MAASLADKNAKIDDVEVSAEFETRSVWGDGFSKRRKSGNHLRFEINEVPCSCVRSGFSSGVFRNADRSILIFPDLHRVEALFRTESG